MQQSVQDVFQKIKDHNLFIRKIREFEDNAVEGEDVLRKQARYYGLIEEIEKNLLNTIDKVKNELRKEFKAD